MPKGDTHHDERHAGEDTYSACALMEESVDGEESFVEEEVVEEEYFYEDDEEVVVAIAGFDGYPGESFEPSDAACRPPASQDPPAPSSSSASSSAPTEGFETGDVMVTVDGHFNNQQEHFYDESDILTDFYEEETLASLYDVEIIDEPEVDFVEASETKSKPTARGTRSGNDVMRRLSARKMPPSPPLSRQKKNYVLKRYKARQDPYMVELRDRLSKRYRWEIVTDGNGKTTKIGTVPWDRHCDYVGDDAQATTTTISVSGAASESFTPSTVSVDPPGGNVESDAHHDMLHVRPTEAPRDYVDDSYGNGRHSNMMSGSVHSDDFTFETYVSSDRYCGESIETDDELRLQTPPSKVEIIVVDDGDEDDAKDANFGRKDDNGKTRNGAEIRTTYKMATDEESIAAKVDGANRTCTPIMSTYSSVDRSAQKVQAGEDKATNAHNAREGKKREDLKPSESIPITGLSSFQLEYRTGDRSILHHYLEERDWSGMTQYLKKLKSQDASVIHQELTRLNSKRQATPLHVAVAKAPVRLTTLIIGLIPFEFRDDILMALDSNGNTPLHIGCETLEAGQESKSYASIIKILTVGAPIAHNTRNFNGDTPLSLLLASPSMRARRTQSVSDFVEAVAEELVESILKANPSLIHERNENGGSLLHSAALNCTHDRVLKVLLDTNEGPSLAQMTDEHGMLPLHYLSSCTSGRIPPVKSARRLIDAYLDGISHSSNTGDTPLHLFVSNIASWIKDEEELNATNTEYLVKLLAGGSDARKSKTPLLMRNNDSLSPLHCCVRFNCPLKVITALTQNKFFDKASVVTDSDQSTPLHMICASSDPQTKLGVIKVVGTPYSGIVTDKNGKTPFLLAVENPNTTKHVIQALGEVNAEAAKMENSKGRLPLHVAIRLKAHESIVKAILKVYPKAVRVVFDGNNNIFHEMCQYETAPGIISGLLQVHPDGAQAQNNKGNTPLHVAAAYNLSLKVIEALIEVYPAGCMVQNISKEVPLHYAAADEAANETAVEFMLKAAPTSILVQDKKGRTPLDRAREAEVAMAVYNVLRTYFRAQQKKNAALAENTPNTTFKSKKKKSKKGDHNDSMTSTDLNDVSCKDFSGSAANLEITALAEEIPKTIAKSKKKKSKKGDLTDSMTSMDLNDISSTDLNGSAANSECAALTERIPKTSAKSRKKKSKKGDLNESMTWMDLNDVSCTDFSGSAAYLGASASRLKKKKKKHKTDGNESSASIALDSEDCHLSIPISEASLEVLGTPKKKKKGTTESDRFVDSTTAPSSVKSKKKKPKGASPVTSPSKTRRRKSVKIENEEAVAGKADCLAEEDLIPLETPKPRKSKVGSTLKTPRSVSSKINHTPTSPVVTRRWRSKKDLSGRPRSRSVDGRVTLTEISVGTNRRHRSHSSNTSSRSAKSPSESAARTRIKYKRPSASGLQEASCTSLSHSSVLPDLITPSAGKKKTNSAIVSDFLATPQLAGESMSFMPQLWGEEESGR